MKKPIDAREMTPIRRDAINMPTPTLPRKTCTNQIELYRIVLPKSGWRSSKMPIVLSIPTEMNEVIFVLFLRDKKCAFMMIKEPLS